MAKPAGTVQELVSYWPPELQRHSQIGRVHRKPFKKEISNWWYQEGGEEYGYINNQQPLDDRRDLRKGHPHLRCIAELRPKICLSVVSVVKAHILDS